MIGANVIKVIAVLSTIPLLQLLPGAATIGGQNAEAMAMVAAAAMAIASSGCVAPLSWSDPPAQTAGRMKWKSRRNFLSLTSAVE
jgi:hypothetical protein